jgi:hypothetical protein
VQPELELGHHAEVAPAAPDRPEQVRVLGDDHFGRDGVVDAQPGLPRQPSHAAAQSQPGDPGVADRTDRHRQTVGLGGRVEVGE